MKKTTNKRLTAHHEAGHAVVADHFNIRISGVSIVPDYENWTAGHVGHEGLGSSSEAGRREEIVFLYAGHAVLVALFGIGDMSQRSAGDHGARDDYERADSIALGSPSWPPLNGIQKGALKRRALAMVRREHDSIRRLALALLDRKKLSDGEVDAVLSGGPLYMEKYPHLARYMKP